VPQVQPWLISWTGPQVGWITDPVPFPPPSLPHLPLFLHPCSFNHSLSCIFSPASFRGSALSSPYCPAKITTSGKSWRDLIHSVPTISQSWWGGGARPIGRFQRCVTQHAHRLVMVTVVLSVQCNSFQQVQIWGAVAFSVGIWPSVGQND